MHYNFAFLLLGALRLCSASVHHRQEVKNVTEIVEYDPATPITLPWEADPKLWQLPALTTRSEQSCKCGPTDACWPSEFVWGLLDIVFGGRLIKTTPIGSVCHSQTIVDNSSFSSYNASQCQDRQTNWNSPDYHELSSSSVMTPYFANNSCNPFEPKASNCLMGTYVRYAVNVTTTTHVRLALAFAQAYNIRFVIRNTGHDFMGKSTGYGALSIWTHHVRGMSMIDKYNSKAYSGPAVKGMAGTTVGELYNFTHDAGYLPIGGECSTVGWAGGYTSGGGHSALTSWKGLAADQTLEFEVILANGSFVTTSTEQNTDLYWALSGGGPGNYGIVWSMTSKVFPDTIVTSSALVVPQGNATYEQFWEFIDYYHTLVPGITAKGAYAYAFYLTGFFQLVPFFAPNQTKADVDAQIAPLIAKLNSLGIAYTSTTVQYSNFRDAFFGAFAPIKTGLYQFGGRLIPASVITENPTGLSNAVKKIAAGGGSIIEAGIAPSLEVAGHPINSVLPAWRDSVMYLITAAAWNESAGAWPANIKARSVITNDWDVALKKIAPNSGAYMSESDQDNPDWKKDWYGVNYARLLSIKQKYDKNMFFYAEKAVGSDYWNLNTEGKMCKSE